mmetsp:Transcript_61843/g.123977  ORF Transcript_61843/g.123977 Transcript_61843/m.123977 type:complete len:315 (-) Transcript_61843:136-1080(-)
MHSPDPEAHTQQKQKSCSNASSVARFLSVSSPSSMKSSCATLFMSWYGTIAPNSALTFSHRSVGQQYFSKQLVIHPFCSSVTPVRMRLSGLHTVAGALPACHAFRQDRHCVPSSVLTYKIPARLTVAGVAYFKSRISKIIFMFSFRGMRSLEGRVRILLSSMTLFMDSIQLASKSPSSMIHLGFESMLPKSRRILDSTPSCHSLVARLVYPYKSCVSITFALMSCTYVSRGLPGSKFRASTSARQMELFPDMLGPIMKLQWRIPTNSSICVIFKRNTSSGSSPSFSHADTTLASNGGSTLRGGSSPGNRSPSRP